MAKLKGQKVRPSFGKQNVRAKATITVWRTCVTYRDLEMYRTRVVKFETRPQMNTPINRSFTTVSLAHTEFRQVVSNAIGVEVTELGVVFALLHASAFFL